MNAILAAAVKHPADSHDTPVPGGTHF